MSRLRRDDASELIAAERDTSPDALEEDSEESAVERDTSPEAREEVSEERAVERTTSPEVLEEASDVTAVPTDVTMLVMVVWKLASSLSAAANSSSVSRAAGAPLMRFVIAALTSTEIFVERDASPETLEDVSLLRAVERTVSPSPLSTISEERAVERDASAF